ncbi:lipid A deacylase LpxR family protein [bacterium]|nr:lipid A deacylase LpxR family protein [bacterium]
MEKASFQVNRQVLVKCHPNASYPVFLILLIFIFLSLISGTVSADSWSYFWENDALVGTDQHYTNGIGISWMSGELCGNGLGDFEQRYGNAMKELIDSVPQVELGPCNQVVGLKVSQMIVTPEDTWRRDRVVDDLPYAGYLSLIFFLNEWDDDSISQYRFSVGIVGPSSGAEITQTLYHRLTGNSPPRGWKYQLEDAWMVGVGYYSSRGYWEKPTDAGYTMNLSTSLGWDIGNFYTGATLGAMFRYGYNFPKNGASVEGFSLGGAGSEFIANTISGQYGWSFNLGAYINTAAYVYIIDSAKDYDIERDLIFTSHVIGMSLYINHIQVTFSLNGTTGLINDSFMVDGWGGLELTRLF